MMQKIDESLYSRQLYVVGKEAMQKMNQSSILISGMSGLGVEIAKCIILSGVKSVTLHDTKNLEINDMSSNYYALNEDIGKKKVDVVKDKLSRLNPYVAVDINTDELSFDFIKKYNTIVICDQLPSTQINLNNFCRENKINFILASTFGVVGSIFCDFGNDFVVNMQVSFPPESVSVVSLEDTIDYGELFEIINATMQQPVDLLETLVQTITNNVAKQFPGVKRIDVSVEKLNPPIDKFTGSAEVKYSKEY